MEKFSEGFVSHNNKCDRTKHSEKLEKDVSVFRKCLRLSGRMYPSFSWEGACLYPERGLCSIRNLSLGSQRKDMNMPDMKGMDMDMSMGEMRRPYWQSVALSALHCGAGCTLADIIGEWFTNYVPVTVAGSQLVGNWVLDFVLALIIGVYFQFYAIREMEKISVGNALTRAFKADFFSLLSWQVGMYGWMAIVYFVLFINEPLPKDTWIFWFMMQLAMLFGFFCAYPMNALLIKLGIKKGM